MMMMMTHWAAREGFLILTLRKMTMLLAQDLGRDLRLLGEIAINEINEINSNDLVSLSIYITYVLLYIHISTYKC